MKIITVAILMILGLTGSKVSTLAFDLDITKTQLETQVGGKWKKKLTNPDIGLMLSLTELPTSLKAAFFGVIPLPYDKAGKEKIDLYLSTCSAPLIVLGHNDQCTVITYTPVTHKISQRISEVLRLKEVKVSEH